jgi:hypothetical protein
LTKKRRALAAAFDAIAALVTEMDQAGKTAAGPEKERIAAPPG